MPSRYQTALNEQESAIIKDLKAYINFIVKDSEIRIMNNVFDALEDVETIDTQDFKNLYEKNKKNFSDTTNYSSSRISSRSSSPIPSPKNRSLGKGKKNKKNKKNKTKRKF
tara:strand:- start:4495 stop:4827 length:333 start_codon:yes stop_codon:yes gene_type:complete